MKPFEAEISLTESAIPVSAVYTNYAAVLPSFGQPVGSIYNVNACFPFLDYAVFFKVIDIPSSGRQAHVLEMFI